MSSSNEAPPDDLLAQLARATAASAAAAAPSPSHSAGTGTGATILSSVAGSTGGAPTAATTLGIGDGELSLSSSFSFVNNVPGGSSGLDNLDTRGVNASGMVVTDGIAGGTTAVGQGYPTMDIDGEEEDAGSGEGEQFGTPLQVAQAPTELPQTTDGARSLLSRVGGFIAGAASSAAPQPQAIGFAGALGAGTDVSTPLRNNGTTATDMGTVVVRHPQEDLQRPGRLISNYCSNDNMNNTIPLLIKHIVDH